MTTMSNDAVYMRISDFARELHQENAEPGVVIAELTEFAAVVIPGAQHAGITAVSRRSHISTPAATGEYPILLDAIQQQHLQGPCMTAAVDDVPVDIDDMEAETRWPAYQADALERTPIRSVMSFQLFGPAHLTGALNVYAESPRAFDAHARAVGEVFTTHASLAWEAARSQGQFAQALASRDIIGQAKGLIMERYNVDAIQAFDMLRKLSQDSNVTVVHVAERIVEADHPLPRAID